jgi:predicted AlkP superfamily phosphohydrolase/phosphomutase
VSQAPRKNEPGLAVVALAALALLLGLTAPADAYIGPGAGVALVGSFLVLLTTLVVAVLSVLAWPFRTLWRLVRRRPRAKPVIRRLIVVGFDGQEPRLTERWMAEGKLPNFKRLKEMGCYSRLSTTTPSVSPVAWSSFSTGTNPGRHNIFDFLDRDTRTYLPRLSSTHIGSVRRFLKLGRLRIPLERPELRLLRRSKPFWTVLGENGVWSTILRVPITFPPDRFYGAELSAMCVPDLLGTQGTFLLYTTRRSDEKFKEGGVRVLLEPPGDRFEAVIQGPENTFLADCPPLELPLSIELDRAAGLARVRVGEQRLELAPGQLSDWVALPFRAAPGVTVSGLCRLQVTEMAEHFSLYVSPVNLDPERPAMPISHPSYYATYLAKRIGPYATLGLAEDTWALNEKVIDDATFLKLTYDIDAEREAMLFTALDHLHRGALVVVFDATDRVQHMFWRYLEEGHPAAAGSDGGPHRNAIEELYRHNDGLVGKLLDRLRPGDLLMVLSDHGFSSFRRGVNLNAWLREEGYLTLKEGAAGTGEWLREVDWSQTRAYALGLTGIFLNLRGREAEGVVAPGEEARALKAELMAKLDGLRDPERGEVAVNEAFDAERTYVGPYVGNAPDLLIAYNAGYRISWDGASGVVAGPVFEDNVKAWSGDHCLDPRLVPGIFLCSAAVDRTDPALVDIAPTALQLFGVEPPRHMEGRPLFEAASLAALRSGKRPAEGG